MKILINFIKSDWYVVSLMIITILLLNFATSEWKLQGDYKSSTPIVGIIFYVLIIFIPAIMFQDHIRNKYK